MMNIFSVLYCEIRKVCRSKVFWLVFLVFALAPIMMGIGTISSSGPNESSWQMYLSQLLNSLSGLGLIGYTFSAAWVFGREYTDNTIQDLLVKPVSRGNIVMSKMLVILTWDILLSIYMFAIALSIGGFMGLTGWSSALIMNIFIRFFITSLLFIIVSTPGAFLANVSKGYLAPIGLILIIVIFSSVLASMGFASYFPWTIPSVFLGSGFLSFSSILILISTGIAGIAGTFVWWRFAEQQ